jgi:CubicO group peptidase (beta-lactamase class C family)
MSTLTRSADRRLRLSLVAALISLAVAPAVRADEADQFQPVRDRIAKALVDHNIPSIAVAVAKDGKIIWEQGFGWADRENRVPATEHTTYSLASISKPIAATGLMVLKQRGKIDLDKPANDYLGEPKLVARVGNAADATVRRVANHTSGLPLHFQFFYSDESYRAPTRDETIRRFGNLVTAPGERFQYSNLGYGVLDYIVERQSGQKFSDFMREEVFLPLGMTHSSINIGPGLEPHQAIRYSPTGVRLPFYDFDHPGASAVYCSAHDLVRFAMFHMKDHLADQRPILKDELIDEMQRPTSDMAGDGYGVGWGSGQSRGYRVVSHSGGMPGVATLCSLVPSEHVAIVVLSNTGTPMPGYLTGMIHKIVLAERKSESKPSSKDASNPSDSAKPAESELVGKWKGHVTTYKGQTPLVLEVKDLRDIHVKLGEQLETLLNGPGFRGGFLRGRFAGDLELTDEARGHKCILQLEAKLRGDVLNGALIMHTVPDGRGTNATTHWVELKRQGPAKQDSSATAPAGG